MKNSKIAILITAAGSSTRMGGSTKKEYLPLYNGTVLTNCAKTFLNALSKKFQITDLVITCPVNGKEFCEEILKADKVLNNLLQLNNLSCKVTEGSTTRQKSVFNGLKKIKESNNNPEIVLIHDGARPFVTEKIILDSIDAAFNYEAAVPGITPTDTQKEINSEGFIVRHLQRSLLTAVQTPQVFNFEKLFSAHEQAQKDNTEYTDDTEIWGKYCGNVKVISGDSRNIKITYPQDLNTIK